MSDDVTSAVALRCTCYKYSCVLLLYHSSQCSLYRDMYRIVIDISRYVS